jgi:hypothetical protein
VTQHSIAAGRSGSWLPSAPLISTKLLEIRKRRVLITVVLLAIVGAPVIFLGLREGFHLADPRVYAPAGSPDVFRTVTSLINEFGFIMAVTLGATAATTDLTDGMFRHLVITGRSRLALYLARIPAGLAIILPLAGLGFALVCLVTAFLGTPQSNFVNFVHFTGPTSSASVSIPSYLDQAQLHSWLLSHPGRAQTAFLGPPALPAAAVKSQINQHITTLYGDYATTEAGTINPSVTGMIKAGLWLELDLLIGFMVGLGLGSLMGQRTVPIILLIFIEIIITPPLALHVLPYFIDGQRLLVGVAMDQLQPASLTGAVTLRPELGGAGAGPALQIPPMPTWAMITVIIGWIVGWSAIGAWRMVTRDA